MATQYYNQASQQVNGSFNKKKQTLQNQLAQQQLALENQKGGINQAYDSQVGEQNLANKKGKNNLSNTMLGRGFANSSIATSGLAEADQINNRMVGNINNARTGDLNNIEAQKQQLASSTAGTLGTMEADKEDAIWSLARQLEDRQWDKDFKNTQLDFSREQERNTVGYRNQQLGIQREQNAINQSNSDRQFNLSQSNSDRDYAFKLQQQADAKQARQQDPREALADVRAIIGSTKQDSRTKSNDLEYFKSLYSGIPGMEYVVKEIDYNLNKMNSGSSAFSQDPLTDRKKSWFR